MSRIDEALRRAGRVPGPSPVPVPSPPEPAALVEPASVPEPHRIAEVLPMPSPAARAAHPDPAPASLAASPPVTELDDDRLITSTGIDQGMVEEFRKLATALHQRKRAQGSKVVLVTSAHAGEGKTVTAVNLALTLSRSLQQRVLLIDTDLRRPRIHDIFRIANHAGLNDGLRAGEGDARVSLVAVAPGLAVLPAGTPNPDPLGGLTSERMRRILADVAARFDWVVLDTPPVGLLPDAHLLAEMADLALLVVRASGAPVADIRRAVETLGRDRVAGVVLNRVTTHTPRQEYHRYAASTDGA